MSCKKRKSQTVLFDARKNRKIEDYFPQAQGQSPRLRNKNVHFGDQSPQNDHKTKPRNKIINISMEVNHKKNKKMKTMLAHEETVSLITALLTLKAIREETEIQKGKEMLVCGTEGIKGYINLGMPLRCFPEGSHVVISFVKNESHQKENNQVLPRYDQVTTDCVIFYIHAIGKGKKCILKCRKLHKEGNKLCVYGIKGETVKVALQRDGRFLSFVQNDPWRLIYDLDTIIENTQPVADLEGKLLQVEVEGKIKKEHQGTRGQNSVLEKRNTLVLKEYIVDEYPSLKREREKIRAYIKEESKGKKNRISLFELHRTNFGKVTKNSTPVKIIKLLSQLSDSVGYIEWNNNGIRGSATCLVFKGLFIMTCRHVINDIVGEGTDPTLWAGIIGECVKVTFDYEEPPVKEDNCFFLESWFEISDVALDYAVLKLKKNGKQVPPELYNGIAPVPQSGLLYIIGHPDGDSKSTDGCAVIPQSERAKKCLENLQATAAMDCRDSMQYVHMFTQRSFQNPDVVTYDTTFYCGSSGSPVFDSKGSLVALHTAGFTCPYQSRLINVIEYGSNMKAIITDIKQKYERWYKEVFANQEDVEMLSEEH